MASRRRAAFKARETGDIPIARRWSRAAAACEGVARERSETRRPEPLVGIKKVIGTRETGDSLSRRLVSAELQRRRKGVSPKTENGCIS